MSQTAFGLTHKLKISLETNSLLESSVNFNMPILVNSRNNNFGDMNDNFGTSLLSCSSLDYDLMSCPEYDSIEENPIELKIDNKSGNQSETRNIAIGYLKDV
jgi:hypothetical protein